METKITKKCDVCGADIITYEYGGGKCKNCGWIDDVHQVQYPDCANANNMISLNRARELWKEHKKFLPNFEEALSLIDRGFDLDIRYKKQEYHLEKFNGKIYIENYAENTGVCYSDISDFKRNAKINGELLSEIWENIEKIEYGF